MGIPSRTRLEVPAWLLGLVLAVMSTAAPAAVTAPDEDRSSGHAASAPAYATGDAWLDARLADIDLFAARYPDAFAAELERYAGVSRAYVHGLLAQPGWSPGDVWFACFLGRAVQATCRAVVRARTTAGADADWATVAHGFDAPAGPPVRTTLRLAMADSYRRWARPLHPDATMNRLLRERDAKREREAKAAP